MRAAHFQLQQQQQQQQQQPTQQQQQQLQPQMQPQMQQQQDLEGAAVDPSSKRRSASRVSWFDERLGEPLEWFRHTKNTFIEFEEPHRPEPRLSGRRERSAPAPHCGKKEEASVTNIQYWATVAALHWASRRPQGRRSRSSRGRSHNRSWSGTRGSSSSGRSSRSNGRNDRRRLRRHPGSSRLGPSLAARSGRKDSKSRSVSSHGGPSKAAMEPTSSSGSRRGTPAQICARSFAKESDCSPSAQQAPGPGKRDAGVQVDLDLDLGSESEGAASNGECSPPPGPKLPASNSKNFFGNSGSQDLDLDLDLHPPMTARRKRLRTTTAATASAAALALAAAAAEEAAAASPSSSPAAAGAASSATATAPAAGSGSSPDDLTNAKFGTSSKTKAKAKAALAMAARRPIARPKRQSAHGSAAASSSTSRPLGVEAFSRRDGNHSNSEDEEEEEEEERGEDLVQIADDELKQQCVRRMQREQCLSPSTKNVLRKSRMMLPGRGMGGFNLALVNRFTLLELDLDEEGRLASGSNEEDSASEESSSSDEDDKGDTGMMGGALSIEEGVEEDEEDEEEEDKHQKLQEEGENVGEVVTDHSAPGSWGRPCGCVPHFFPIDRRSEGRSTSHHSETEHELHHDAWGIVTGDEDAVELRHLFGPSRSSISDSDVPPEMLGTSANPYMQGPAAEVIHCPIPEGHEVNQDSVVGSPPPGQTQLLAASATIATLTSPMSTGAAATATAATTTAGAGLLPEQHSRAWGPANQSKGPSNKTLNRRRRRQQRNARVQEGANAERMAQSGRALTTASQACASSSTNKTSSSEGSTNNSNNSSNSNRNGNRSSTSHLHTSASIAAATPTPASGSALQAQAQAQAQAQVRSQAQSQAHPQTQTPASAPATALEIPTSSPGKDRSNWPSEAANIAAEGSSGLDAPLPVAPIRVASSASAAPAMAQLPQHIAAPLPAATAAKTTTTTTTTTTNIAPAATTASARSAPASASPPAPDPARSSRACAADLQKGGSSSSCNPTSSTRPHGIGAATGQAMSREDLWSVLQRLHDEKHRVEAPPPPAPTCETSAGGLLGAKARTLPPYLDGLSCRSAGAATAAAAAREGNEEEEEKQEKEHDENVAATKEEEAGLAPARADRQAAEEERLAECRMSAALGVSLALPAAAEEEKEEEAAAAEEEKEEEAAAAATSAPDLAPPTPAEIEPVLDHPTSVDLDSKEQEGEGLLDHEHDNKDAAEEEIDDDAEEKVTTKKKKKSKSAKKRQQKEQQQQQEQEQLEQQQQQQQKTADDGNKEPAASSGGKRLEDSPADRLAVFTAKLNEVAIAAEVRQSGRRSVLLAVRVNPPVRVAPAGTVKDTLTIEMGSVALCEASDGNEWCFGTMLAPKSAAGSRGCYRKDGLRVVMAELTRLPNGDTGVALLPSNWSEVDRLAAQSGNTQDRLKRKALLNRMKAAEAAWQASNPKSGS